MNEALKVNSFYEQTFTCPVNGSGKRLFIPQLFKNLLNILIRYLSPPPHSLNFEFTDDFQSSLFFCKKNFKSVYFYPVLAKKMHDLGDYLHNSQSNFLHNSQSNLSIASILPLK